MSQNQDPLESESTVIDVTIIDSEMERNELEAEEHIAQQI